MPTYLDLCLYAPRESPGADPREVAPPPPSVPAALENVGGALNDAFLVAEAIGLDAGEALHVVNTTTKLLGTIDPTYFSDDDLPTLCEWLAAVVAALHAGLDEEGTPHGETGTRLGAFPSFVADTDGTLILRARHQPLVALRDKLDAVLSMFDYAAANDLWIAVRER
jgi:hypothetical protein